METSTKRKVLAVMVLALTLTACGSTVGIEDVDGTRCVVARRNINDRVTSISCDWGGEQVDR